MPLALLLPFKVSYLLHDSKLIFTFPVAIPFAFYIFARRYVYEIEQADDTYKVKHLSPLMWTTRTTVARSADIAFPSQNEMLQSFSVGGRKFLWDRAFIADGDYNRMMRDARGIDFENAAYLNLQAETSATLKLVEDFAKKNNANEA